MNAIKKKNKQVASFYDDVGKRMIKKMEMAARTKGENLPFELIPLLDVGDA